MGTISFSRAILPATLLAMSCSRAPVLSISNHSAVAISNVVVSGAGFSEAVGTLEPGSTKTLTVHPRGESGVRLAFDAAGLHVDTPEQDYFEANGGYRVRIDVDRNFHVGVSSALASY